VLSEAIPQHRAGKAAILASSGAKRSAIAPEVPTFTELGFPQIQGDGWFAFHAPAKTPKAVVDRLSSAFGAAIRTPEVTERLYKIGFEPVGSSADELAKRMAEDRARWAPIVKASGFSVDHSERSPYQCGRTSFSSWPTISAMPISVATGPEPVLARAGSLGGRRPALHQRLLELAGLLADALRADDGALAVPPARRQRRADREPPSRRRDAGLPPAHPTLASLLRDAGYATALAGKWHIGFLPHFGPLKSGYQDSSAR
jgi:hypothetical protein